MPENRWFWILSGVFILLFVAGVVMVIVLSNRPFPDYDIVSPTALPQFDPFVETQTAQQREIQAAMNVSTPTAVARNMCGWQWASQANPELSAEIQMRLDERLPDSVSVEAQAESFGENCINGDGTAAGFGAMQTDFRITVTIDNLPDGDAGAIIEIIAPVLRDILLVLSDYPPDTNPGPMSGMIGIEFTGQDTVRRMWANYGSVMDILGQGLSGRALLTALSIIEA